MESIFCEINFSKFSVTIFDSKVLETLRNVNSKIRFRFFDLFTFQRFDRIFLFTTDESPKGVVYFDATVDFIKENKNRVFQSKQFKVCVTALATCNNIKVRFS